MKKINNKGMTAIEILVCFALVSVIIISMFNVVNNYKNKQEIESYKSDIMTYKTTVTSTVYDDIIKNKGITGVTITENEYDSTINITYLNGETATLVIHNQLNESDYNNSIFYISFKNSENVTDKFDLPKIPQLVYNGVKAVNNDGIINIGVGLEQPELGTKYDVLNIITPNVKTYPGML